MFTLPTSVASALKNYPDAYPTIYGLEVLHSNGNKELLVHYPLLNTLMAVEEKLEAVEEKIEAVIEKIEEVVKEEEAPTQTDVPVEVTAEVEDTTTKKKTK